MRERETVEQAIAGRLKRPDATIELTDGGLYVDRKAVHDGGFRAAERALADRPLRVFDFRIAKADLAENIHDGERFREGYAGVPGPGGAPIFRVDHHYEVAALRAESTTPLVLRWLLALHEAGRADVLGQVAAARWLADHCDPDILLAHHLAAAAVDRAYLEELGPALAAAARRNDHLEDPPAHLEPRASRALFASLAIEEAITAGRMTFFDAQRRWLPALGRWLRGAADSEEADRLAAWEAGARSHEEATLAAIGRWHAEGRLRTEAGGRLVVLEAPDEIDNSTLFIYVRRNLPHEGPRAQLLVYPVGAAGEVLYKVRSHGGLELAPIFEKLKARLPGSGFDGRASAGGSKPMAPATAAVLEELTAAVSSA